MSISQISAFSFKPQSRLVICVTYQPDISLLHADMPCFVFMSRFFAQIHWSLERKVGRLSVAVIKEKVAACA